MNETTTRTSNPSLTAAYQISGILISDPGVKTCSSNEKSCTKKAVNITYALHLDHIEHKQFFFPFVFFLPPLGASRHLTPLFRAQCTLSGNRGNATMPMIDPSMACATLLDGESECEGSAPTHLHSICLAKRQE